nr:DUF1524 domain-containing protein [Kineosporia rhizophila]
MTGLAVLTSGAASPSAGAEAVAKAPVVQGLTARQGLAVLKVKGRAPKTGYARDQFGPAWSDVDGNTCDTRNDVLRRDLADITVADDWCIVLTGVLTDPYGREMISFRRGTKTSAAVQVDHVVALADAWTKGAQTLSRTARLRFANDPLNLLATSGVLNRKKQAGDAATWLPPRKSFRCEYVARQIAVKRIYRLWVTKAEHRAMVSVLADCPDEPLPSRDQVSVPPLQEPEPEPGPTSDAPTPPEPTSEPSSSVPATTTTEPDPSTTTNSSTPTATPTTQAGSDPRFSTCAAAKRAGYGPYVRGRDAEYDWYRDADSDGVVCE